MDSDSDELAELLRAAADEGELNFNENIAPNSNSATITQSEVSKTVTPNETDTVDKTKNGKDGDQPIKLTEDAYDSSDEEDLQNFFERKYNEYGRDINTMLKRKDADRIDLVVGNEVDKNLRKSNFNSKTIENAPKPPPPATTVRSQSFTQPAPKNENVFTDPIFGIRIVQPLISSTMLRERMIGRNAVEIRYLQNYLQSADLAKDWCLSGVIVNKGPVQTSNAGSQYVIWRISDLKGEIKTVSLFLFKAAFKELWKTPQGMVIAVLNPTVFSRKDSNTGESSLSIDSAQRVMILGKSKDFGICKSKKKNGDQCTAIVNLNLCEFCVYHVKQEYAKFSTRSDLQSATSGRGLQSLKNKVLGKNEVFYGGKSFMAEPSKPSKKVIAKDQKRLMSLSETFGSSPMAAAVNGSSRPDYLQGRSRGNRIAETVPTSAAQRMKDLERLKILNGSQPSTSTASPSTSSPAPQLTQQEKLALMNVNLNKTPSLSQASFSFTLSSPTPRNKNDLAKAKAAALLQKKPIEKSNPNFIKYRGTDAGKKRVLENIELDSTDGNASKKQKLAEEVEKFRNEKIRQLVAAKSSHCDLIELHEANVQDQYFNKLEKKEAMEEKMLNTTKLECKAVICLVCKYKAFSAAQRCKDENHKLKVVEAEKRFYECEDCQNRTITLFRIPKISCSNCQGSRWKRTGMIRDKSSVSNGEHLSLRGDEELFIGNLQSKGNLNLCVAAE